ncbi:isochorismatase [Streptomyces sp. HUCO-GS316]|uniref:phosphopantetheine-binding protein n=1 Tax=Streptomyces sp. HUCO-GS316 TaxID=2692198 RepID=UPI00136ED0CB|nr:phosphopantetheine-binding protein [Streptomyces sp. HUCO-GS316]MXM68616.1 isochorismatase [Streptomyces sp. HUCO-GS316]
MTDSSNRTNATTPTALTGEELRTALAELIGISPSEIEDDANLIQLGLESLAMMRLVTKWRRAGIAVAFGELSGTPTFAAWNERITQELAKAGA